MNMPVATIAFIFGNKNDSPKTKPSCTTTNPIIIPWERNILPLTKRSNVYQATNAVSNRPTVILCTLLAFFRVKSLSE